MCLKSRSNRVKTQFYLKKINIKNSKEASITYYISTFISLRIKVPCGEEILPCQHTISFFSCIAVFSDANNNSASNFYHFLTFTESKNCFLVVLIPCSHFLM